MINKKERKKMIMVKILYKCIPSILVYDIFYRQTAQYCIHCNSSGILSLFMK